MEQMCVNGKPFSVIQLLGHGKGGYSYLVTDGQNKYVLKQIHHEPCDYYQFGDKLQSEIHDYRRLQEVGIPMPEMYDVDVPNERILKQYIQGQTIAQIVAQDQLKPGYVAQVRQMAESLQKSGLNIDYYPTNFVVQEERLYYIDYECNCYDPQWNFENWGIKYWYP